MNREETLEARSVIVSGRVQKVGFRWAVAREAENAGISGWVCNLPDGRVQALIVGQLTEVDRVVNFMRQGPPTARVDSLECKIVEPPQRSIGFRVTEEPEGETHA